MRWLRYGVYVVLFGVWLSLILFPCMAFSLAMREEIQVGNGERTHVRVFLLQEVEKEGVGLEWQRPLLFSDGCHKTAVTYLMWAGEGDSVSYCQCPDTQNTTLTAEQIRSCAFP